jgi:hypothetical protein
MSRGAEKQRNRGAEKQRSEETEEQRSEGAKRQRRRVGCTYILILYITLIFMTSDREWDAHTY